MCRKKFIFKGKTFITLLIGIFILSGCGQSKDIKINSNDVNVETNTKISETEAQAENLPNPLGVPKNIKVEDINYYSKDNIDLSRSLHRCVSDEKNIYLVHGEAGLYVMPIGTDEHNPVNIDNPEGMDVCNIALDSYGRIHLLMAGLDNEEWFIWRLDESYHVDKTIDISAYFETKHMPLWFMIDKDGTYYLQWVMDRNGIIIDNEGVLKHKFTRDSLGVKWIYEAAVGKNGQIYLVYSTSDVKLEIGRLDVNKCLIENETPTLYFGGNEVFDGMYSGSDTNLLLVSPYSGVWAYDSESGVLENRVPLSDIGFNMDMEFWPLTFLPDSRLLLLGQTVNFNDADDDAHETADDESLKHWLLKYITVGQ